MNDSNLSGFLWSVADLLRGDYKQSDYGKVILPFTVLRRLDCVLEATKPAVLAELAKRQQAGINPEPFLLRKSGQLFYNTSELDLKKLMGDQSNIGENLRSYLQGFSPAVRDIFESFEFHTQIDRLAKSGLLYLVTEKFANIDLHPVQYGAAQEQFNISHAVNFWVPTPPRAEQEEIAAFLEKETAKFDALIDETLRTIDLLQERRAALVSAAVTGQIDVRGFVERKAA